VLVCLTLILGAAHAQSTAGATSTPTVSPDTRAASDSVEQQAATRIAAAVCNKRLVLLGELPEHGEARAFGVKARVVERLVTSCGFRAVLFEAGSYDFFGVERALATSTRSSAREARGDSLDLALARAIGGFWWTRELGDWRRWILHEAIARRVVIGGLDDQPSATAAYARATLPGLVGVAAPPARAAECQEAVVRYLNFSYTATLQYDSTERARLVDCTRLAADRARVAHKSAKERTPDDVMLDNLTSYFARERSTADRGAAAAADRDSIMASNLAWWSARLPRDARIVVWTATTHAARAPNAESVLPLGVRTLGARAAEQWGDRLAVIGFTALEGQWSRAGRPSQALAPLASDALEARALAGQTGGDVAKWAYLDMAALRALGPVPSRLFGKVVTNDWSTAFDGVLVIRNEVAPTFEPRR
jgi:erythromycin esterase-like protein